MRVLMVSERWFPTVGGGEYHIRSMAEELVKLVDAIETTVTGYVQRISP